MPNDFRLARSVARLRRFLSCDSGFAASAFDFRKPPVTVTETGSQGSGVTSIELIAIASQQLRILTTSWRSVPQRFCSLYGSGGFGLCISNTMKSLQDSWKNVASSGFGAIGPWNESR